MENRAFASMYHINHDQFDYIEQSLEQYNIEKYAISFESHNSKGEDDPHFHLFYYTYKQNQTNWEKHIVEKYKLRRKGRGGKIKYGTLKSIRDLQAMLSYTLKHEYFRSKGFTETELQFAIEQSFLKTETKQQNQLILETLIEEDTNFESIDQIRYHLIKIIRHKFPKVPITKSRIEYIAIQYLRDHSLYADNTDPSVHIFEILYNKQLYI